MANDYFMEIFDNETAVLNKIHELKSQGITEEHLYIAVQDKEQLSRISGHTDSASREEGKDIKEKFTNFLSGDHPFQQALKKIGIEDEEAKPYVQEVKNGKILLFSDMVQGAPSKGRELNANAAYGDPLENENSPFPPEHLKNEREDMATGRNNVRDSADVTADKNAGTLNTASSDRHDVTPINPNATGKQQQPRVVSTDHNDLEEMGSAKDAMPAGNPNMTDVPSADQRDNDVPAADRSENRLSDTEAPEEWPQAASDRIRSEEKEQ